MVDYLFPSTRKRLSEYPIPLQDEVQTTRFVFVQHSHIPPFVHLASICTDLNYIVMAKPHLLV